MLNNIFNFLKEQGFRSTSERLKSNSFISNDNDNIVPKKEIKTKYQLINSKNDFEKVLNVHLLGSVKPTKAVWEIMKEQNYGRIVMTTSSSGLYGNFGQTNYGAAKMGLIGFMNTLVLEGGKYNIHVNALSPTANTRMTEDLLPAPMLDLMTAESVTAGALTLCHDNAPNRTILCCGAGGYAKASIYETDGIFISKKEQTPENVIENWEALTDPTNHKALEAGGKQTEKFIMKAMSALQN